MEETKPKIWSRLFSLKTDKELWWFDAFFGIIWPIIAIFIDPGIIGTSIWGRRGFLEAIKWSFYIEILILSCTFIIWLIFKQKVKKLSGVFAGMFLTGGFVALGIQLIQKPFEFLIGLITLMTIFSDFVYGLLRMLIIVLGLLTILPIIVYVRNGLAAIRQAKLYLRFSGLIASGILGVVILTVPPILIQWQISSFCSNNIQIILDHESHLNEHLTEVSTATHNLKTFNNFCTYSLDDIVWAYSYEDNPARKEFLADTYFEILQEDIEDRLHILIY